MVSTVLRPAMARAQDPGHVSVTDDGDGNHLLLLSVFVSGSNVRLTIPNNCGGRRFSVAVNVNRARDWPADGPEGRIERQLGVFHYRDDTSDLIQLRLTGRL
jgi:hypothetical protein